MRKWLLAVVGALALATVVQPQTSRPVRVFEGARLIVGDGRPAIDNADFVVDGDTMTAVGPKGCRGERGHSFRFFLIGMEEVDDYFFTPDAGVTSCC